MSTEPSELVIFISVKTPSGNNIGLKDVSIFGLSGNNTASQQFKILQPKQEVKISSSSDKGKMFVIDPIVKDTEKRAEPNVDR